MSTIVDAKPTSTVWRVPMTAQYGLWAADLASHPMLAQLLESGSIDEGGAHISLDTLPPFAYDSLQVTVDGATLPRGTRLFLLRIGSRGRARHESFAARGRAAGVARDENCGRGPEEPFVF